MTHPPKDCTIFVIRFGFSAVFFGIIFALVGLRMIDSLDVTNLAVWIITTLAVSCYTAWIGDEAWARLIGFLRWW